MNWLKRAFAVEPDEPLEPTPLQQPIVDWFCIQIAKRHLTTPGILFLEMCRPLNYVTSQAMRFLQPSVWALAGQQSYASYMHFAKFLERRASIEYLIHRVEHFETEFTQLQEDGQPVGKFIEAHLSEVRAAAAEYEKQLSEADSDKERTEA